VFSPAEELARKLRAAKSVTDPITLEVVFFASRMHKPVLIEGPRGCAKTQLAGMDERRTNPPKAQSCWLYPQCNRNPPEAQTHEIQVRSDPLFSERPCGCLGNRLARRHSQDRGRPSANTTERNKANRSKGRRHLPEPIKKDHADSSVQPSAHRLHMQTIIARHTDIGFAASGVGS
jgi:hypothetical protein